MPVWFQPDRLKEMSMNHNMKAFLLLLSDSFTLLNSELNDKHTYKKISRNFNTTANPFICFLTFMLLNFSEFLGGHSLFIF
jgi:hypothetical protein